MRTALYDDHIKSGARIVDFAGWEMPVYYRGILEEVRAVRQAAGLFDVSHMGSLFISGPGATDLLDFILPSWISTLELSQARYSMFCNQSGGVLDDLIVYRLEPERYLLIVNASNREKDREHLLRHAGEGIHLTDETLVRGLLAIQGPKASTILQRLTTANLAEVKPFYFTQTTILNEPVLIAHTGYTGEDGFEILTSAASSPRIWRALLQAGEEDGIQPCGLGARDILRIEAGLPLYGHELSEQLNPYEAGFGWVVKLDKPDFLGRDALLTVRKEGPKRKIRGLELSSRAIPRTDYPVCKSDEQVGYITSGTFSPTLNKTIALALIKAGIEDTVQIEIRNQRVPAQITSLPFYRKQQ